MRVDNKKNATTQPRQAGVVMHITSLPGRFGIGEIGEQARAFVDSMLRMNLSVWQFLPLGPTAYGDSPYQPLSTFAGNEMLIDIQDLITRGLLTAAEASPLAALPADFVDYGALIPLKSKLLTMACGRFEAIADTQQKAAFGEFVTKHDRLWLHDYALFRLLKAHNEELPWYQWEQRYAHRNAAALRRLQRENASSIKASKILQFLFFDQWQALRKYANAAGIQLFADMPIYIAHDSADAWAHPELLCLDNDGRAVNVAGVPPDYFSEDGQLWGNPLYDWQYHAATGYQWWIERLRAATELADLVRIDHFRGFESYWSISADADTARNGCWKPGPGDAIFEAFADTFATLPIIAEDLGVITAEVEALRDRHHLTGMAVLQFIICDHDFSLENIPYERICYTGTHDNNTTLGWFLGSDNDRRPKSEILASQQTILSRTGGSAETVSIDIIQLAFSTAARIAIAPMQDILSMDSSARMNTPGTTDNNWRWRMQSEQLSDQVCDNIRALVKDSERS